MHHRLVTTAVALVAALSLTACEGAEKAASDISEETKNAARQAAKDTAKAELCRYVEDKKVTPTEAIALKAAADVAEGAGVDPTIVQAARTVANVSSGNAPQNDVEKLASECTKPA
jgi:hypothetical protein